MTASTEPVDPVVIAQLGRPYGIKGWVWLQVFTRPIENIKRYRDVTLRTERGETRPAQFEKLTVHPKGVTVKIAGFDDRTAVESLGRAEVVVDREALPPAGPNEYYWRDLIGCEVVHLSGQVLGEVKDMMETGANDVLVVQGDRERLIPFLPDEVIRAVDLDERRIEVDWDPDF
ncbi:ribosome maturation factor RimM [Guyparkeria halophila]|uniref:Ribosome maturation factor RimM n=1 Tax=Guyparkeria halophila TaxID=47960 RepID=A0A6I6D4B9_9GAMM|nr:MULTISPECIES: ribosome maturation factor RimM [Guyparkeria]QGT79117.1 ribosome maturation factor RimM [Guyparkeria halophila]TKA90639.1 ribosome maturation factor RimM [Guyparkeria sp. SB14A]